MNVFCEWPMFFFKNKTQTYLCIYFINIKYINTFIFFFVENKESSIPQSRIVLDAVHSLLVKITRLLKYIYIYIKYIVIYNIYCNI